MLTVLGGSGFIGSHLVRWLEAKSVAWWAPSRDENLRGRDLGHVIYCIGLTGDFRFHRHATVEAHVCKLERLLDQAHFESLTYLSSTRLYRGGSSPAREDARLHVNPSDADDLYNISKAMGESLLLASTKPAKVIRLSHVYGLDWDSRSFLSTIVTDAVEKGRVALHSSLESERDYISIDEVLGLILNVSTQGTQRIYNVASGRNTSNRELVSRLVDVTGCEVEVDGAASTVRFPEISVDRIRDEFGFKPRDVLDSVAELVELFQNESRSRR
jgi:nucleoside-diphosphate-sugar epimerase